MLIEAYRLAWRPVSVTFGVGRWIVDVSLDVAGDAALAALDAVLASPRADEAADRILASLLAEHATSEAAIAAYRGATVEPILPVVVGSREEARVLLPDDPDSPR